ncbi:MAG TPA: hypothetical protein VJR58_11655 [Vineibacter sp.]|nr:hypothetical protein [Vineibacter sp.]
MVTRYNIDPSGGFNVHGMTKFYDIGNAVGIPVAPGDSANPPNERLDVLLVQYMLSRVYEGETFKPTGPLYVDGIFGPLTHYWMLFFYTELESEVETSMFLERGNFVPFARNAITRFDNDLGNSLIGLLNVRMFRKVPNIFATLTTSDPRMPHALKRALDKH